MPSDSPRIDTVPEVQSIKITADSHGMRQALRVFYKIPGEATDDACGECSPLTWHISLGACGITLHPLQSPSQV